VSPLWLVVYGSLLLAVVLTLSGLTGMRRFRRLGGALQLLTSLLLLALAALALVVAMGVHGYRAFTQEVTAATVDVRRLAPQTYRATVSFAGGGHATYELDGDELYVDAHILKWKPVATLLGLHTGYRLDRIAGRYSSIEDERSQPHTVFVLQPGGRVDVFDLARRFPVLAPLVDARYGSGTFVSLGSGGRFLVRVTTSGLLVRRVGASPGPQSTHTR
jgi:hypothetical protein